MVPGQSCWRKVYVATSREAELESPPPRGTELTTTALKPMSGEAAGVGKKDADKGSVDVGKKKRQPAPLNEPTHPSICCPLSVLA